MPEAGLLLAEPTPVQALAALARLEGGELVALAEAGMRVLSAHYDLLGTRVQLLVPLGKDLRGSYETLRRALEESAGTVHERRCELAPDEGMGLAAALPWLLVRSGEVADRCDREPGEWLLVARDLESPAEAKLFEDLRFHTTSTRVATAMTGRGRVTLFHVRDDPRRGSSLRSLRAAGGLAAAVELAAFRIAEQTIFLPEAEAPEPQALASFHQLVRRAPALFGLGPAAEEAERLLAIFPGPPSVVYALDRLPFVDPTALAPAATEYGELEVQALEHSAEALEVLHREIGVQKTGVGYRLELRPTAEAPASETEVQRLAEQIADLEQRLAYVESLRGPRPVLLRFSPRQLPALADALRCFSPDDLRDGLIQYGFQLSGGDPVDDAKLWHYLFFDPRTAVMAEHLPLWRWNHLDAETMRFWLDPFWAHLSRDRTTDCLVFVPSGSTLFPVLHSWEPGDMDQYLRRAVRGWFPGEAAAEALPERPIYLFDREPPGDGEQRLRVHVLDREAFVPVQIRLGWINDNLELQRALGGAGALIAGLASDTTRLELASRLRSAADEAEQEFFAAAEAANRTVAEGATELLAAMTGELAEIARQCRETERAIARQHRQLRTLKEALEEITAAGKEATETRDQIAHRIARRDRALGAMIERIERLDEQQKEAERKAEAQIRGLQRTYHRLAHLLRGG